ncbi:MAG: CDP-diacylglycerol--glycerol-3-phosphate 3-phosphatidyltransferase [Oscillospiraceae bacterium]|nr:CDP-diacylglycerol--glycerol-3-phosphate 3-phosphatidyltransferase [Oscillospiraceae bacterium]MDY3790946.1 CDP-diacylglycerol--glycerol-3-phosphate 3-phosphatidyltransferase [Oscillospiraceae bacterium]MDY6208648.1 CDP-diacylglycerol--glycerol-3-phosphate 3-phosphatidyltransferase [Oscillospiraceae bacterium]
MNLPNKLTVARVVLVPFFIFFLLTDIVPMSSLWALVVFALASITDALDGHIARSRNLVTNFGKFLDPLADKVLVISALVCFVDMDLAGAVPVIIIIAREFMVSGLRLVTAGEGVVVAAGIWGKLKTAFTMVAIVVILLFAVIFGKDSACYETWVVAAEQTLIWISTALTVISGVIYLNGYKSYINTDK